MTLLRQIQADLAATDVDVTAVLRKCKILARRLRSDTFANWVNWELDGYPDDVEVPAYRFVQPHHYASFSNGYWKLENQPISPILIEEKWRPVFESHPYRGGVEALKTLAETGGTIMRNELRFLLKGKVVDLPCLAFWSTTPAMQFKQILSAVISRLLEFVMDVEDENPEAGEAATDHTPVPPARIQQLIHNHFHAPVGNVAQLNGAVTQSATINYAELRRLMSDARAQLSLETLDPDTRATTEAQIATIEAQLSAPSPNEGIVREAGRSLRTIIEGAIAGVASQPTTWATIAAALSALVG